MASNMHAIYVCVMFICLYVNLKSEVAIHSWAHVEILQDDTSLLPALDVLSTGGVSKPSECLLFCLQNGMEGLMSFDGSTCRCSSYTEVDTSQVTSQPGAVIYGIAPPPPVGCFNSLLADPPTGYPYIPDSAITADTTAPECSTAEARYSYTEELWGWCSLSEAFSTEYIEVDLGAVRQVTQIKTKGRTTTDEYFTSYMLMYRNNVSNSYQQVMNGPSPYFMCTPEEDGASTTNDIPEATPIFTTGIRLYPTSFNINMSGQIDIIGC